MQVRLQEYHVGPQVLTGFTPTGTGVMTSGRATLAFAVARFDCSPPIGVSTSNGVCT